MDISIVRADVASYHALSTKVLHYYKIGKTTENFATKIKFTQQISYINIICKVKSSTAKIFEQINFGNKNFGE